MRNDFFHVASIVDRERVMRKQDGGYIVLMFVRGPETSAEVMENVDEYRTFTLKYILNEADAVGRVQIYQAP